MIEEILEYKTQKNINIKMNFYKSSTNRKNITILYFHGGGLLYGTRDDLPKPYLEKFLNAGYDFLTLDYPLAPESNIKTIVDSAYEGVKYFIENHNKILGLESNEYILFGRSAGGYLSFITCNNIIKTNEKLPLAIISLYGYTRLDEKEFITPSKHYLKLPLVTDESVKKIISNAPVTYGPMNERFSLYIKARQAGNWIETLCENVNPLDYSITEEELLAFPKTILVAASSDPDVPYRISKKLSKTIKNSKLITFYEDVHDFDRDLKSPSGKEAYDKIIQWLE